MKFKIKDLKGFESRVFGADCFLKNWPHIATDGIEIAQIDDFSIL